MFLFSQNILGLQGVPHEFFLEVYYTFYKIPEARIGDVVLGLLCLALLVALLFMKTTLGSEDAPTCSRVARKLVWGVATSQYLCGCDHVSVSVHELVIFKDNHGRMNVTASWLSRVGFSPPSTKG